MCGIVGYIGSAFKASQIVLDGLEKLEYRGYDSAGIAVYQKSDGRIHVRRDSGKLRNIRQKLEKDLTDNNVGIGHTRWATHGRPTQNNAHPHKDHEGRVVVVHNGIIENYLDIKEKLLAAGHEFSSETDTEIVAHLIAYHDRGQPFEAFMNALRELKGAYALAVLFRDQPDQIFVARKNCPLLVGITENEGQFVASDVAPMLSYTRDVVFLDEDQAGIVTSEGLKLFCVNTGEPISFQTERVDWNPVMAEKQGYKHFMMKEIHEQPDVIRNTIGTRTSEEQGEVLLEDIGINSARAQSLSRIVITACGTAYYAGLVGKYLLEKASQIPVDVDLASEFRYRDPILDENTLVVAVSQSGETADTLAAIDLAKQKGAHTLGIINVKGSTMTRKVDGTLYIHAGPEIGVASTKAYMAMLVAFQLLSMYLGRLRGNLEAERCRKLIHELKVIPQLIEEMLKKKKLVEEIASKYMNFSNFLFLGRDINYPTALEGALKLKEISYIHAEGYAAGEMKHGPIALLDKNCPVVAVMTRGPLYEKIVSNVQESRSRDCRVLGIVTENDQQVLHHVDDSLEVPDIDPVLSPLINVLPLQLFAYYVADLKGADVDQPRNLAKSVTVE